MTLAEPARRPGPRRVVAAGHVYNPHFLHGTKTYVYELREDLGGALPDEGTRSRTRPGPARSSARSASRVASS